MSRHRSSPPEPDAAPIGKVELAEPAFIEGLHFYREGPYMVLTARAHLERGYCCGNGCRHCPYGGERSAPADPR